MIKEHIIPQEVLDRLVETGMVIGEEGDFADALIPYGLLLQWLREEKHYNVDVVWYTENEVTIYKHLSNKWKADATYYYEGRQYELNRPKHITFDTYEEAVDYIVLMICDDMEDTGPKTLEEKRNAKENNKLNNIYVVGE